MTSVCCSAAGGEVRCWRGAVLGVSYDVGVTLLWTYGV